MFIGDYLGRRTMYSPDQEAFVDTGKPKSLRLSFSQANTRANRVGNWLRDRGVCKGDRVAILAKDGIEHLDVFFACGKLGAIHTALNWRLHWNETLLICQETQPSVLFFSDDCSDQVAKIQETYPVQCVHLEGTGIHGSHSFDDVLRASTKPVYCHSLVEEDIAALIFTGGTTGLPKAAQVSHRMIAWNTLNTCIHDLRHGDRYLNVFPLFHTGGMFVYTVPLVILGGENDYDASVRCRKSVGAY